jgi:hypothetical protein
VLKGCDGIVFVADSTTDKRDENIESLVNLEQNLCHMDRELAKTPLVLQYNKRDLTRNGARTLSLEEMDRDLNPMSKLPWFGASALYGHGVKDTFKAICMMTIADVCRQLI